MRRLVLLLVCLLACARPASASPIPHLFCLFNGLDGASAWWSGQDIAYGCFYDIPAGTISTHVYLGDELIQADSHRIDPFVQIADDGWFWMIPAARLTDCCRESRAGRLIVNYLDYDPGLYAFTLGPTAQVQPIPEPGTLLLLSPIVLGLWRRHWTCTLTGATFTGGGGKTVKAKGREAGPSPAVP